MENEEAKLVWVNVKDKEYGGYWYCSVCGTIYHQPQNWNPYANYCMRCKSEWVNENDS